MTTMIQELAAHPELIYRHGVEDYHEMIASGTIIEGEPFELLDGQIVRKIRSAAGEGLMTVGVEHALIVSRLAKLSVLFEPFGCHIRTQQPITLPPRDESEPDGLITRGTLEDYTANHPGAADALCIVEVAESSLARDRGYKFQLYANAGIPMYLIVNLIDRAVEMYRDPMKGTGTFARFEQFTQGQTIDFPTSALNPVTVPVDLLFLR
jgi:Uma2 family endonuclease